MTIERVGGKDNKTPAQRPARTGPVAPLPTETGRIRADQARFTEAARDNTRVHMDLAHYPVAAPPDEHHTEATGHEVSAVDEIAHVAHNPHGALHLVEAGEQGIHLATRIVGRAGRAANVAAELAHAGGDGHHGILQKAEHGVERFFKAGSRWLGSLVRSVPGGNRGLNAIQRTLGVPGRMMGPGLDAALQGTKLGNAVRLTGSGGRVVGAMGGRLPVIGAVFGAFIAVSDVRGSIAVIRDKHATTTEKVVAGTQGVLSASSGAIGGVALGAAGLVALGVITAPFSIPAALGLAAILGTGAFVMTFFKKKEH